MSKPDQQINPLQTDNNSIPLEKKKKKKAPLTRLTFSLNKVTYIRVDQQEVEGNRSHNVDEEPTPQVVQGDLPRMRDHLVVVVDVSRTEVDHNVNHEHDVNCGED